MIKAEVEYDDQHGPIVTVRTAEETVSVYLCAETGVVTTEKGQYGLEVSGPWFKVRAVLCPEGGAYRDYLLRENRLLREELAEARKPKTEREHAAVREIERMRHDIERHIAIASEHATECERLRAELANKDQILGDTLAVLCGDGGHYRAEHGDIKAKEHGLKRYHDLLVSEDGLRAELAEYRQDAKRYRWLRYPRMGWDIVRKTDGELLCAEYLDGIELDAAIDASRKGEGEV